MLEVAVCGQCIAGFYMTGGWTSSATCQPCPAGTYSSAAGSTSLSTCQPCPAVTYSLAGSSTCTPSGLSCRDIINRIPSSLSGWYFINTSLSANLRVYCDMTTDRGAAYTTLPCNGCTSVNQVDTVMPNGCTALGLKMVIPRTQAHWSSLLNFVTSILGASLSNFFKIVPGVYMSTNGIGVSGNVTTGFGSRTCSIMNYANCSSEWYPLISLADLTRLSC